MIKEVGCDLNQVCVVDVTEPDIERVIDDGKITKGHGLGGAKAMIVCTSAVPKVSKLSLILQFLRVPYNLVTKRKPFDFRELRIYYAEGQHPEKVDYEGQMKQFDLARKLAVDRVILVSSMGGTDPDNFLGSGNGDILRWKRKAERYLIDVSNVK